MILRKMLDFVRRTPERREDDRRELDVRARRTDRLIERSNAILADIARMEHDAATRRR